MGHDLVTGQTRDRFSDRKQHFSKKNFEQILIPNTQPSLLNPVVLLCSALYGPYFSIGILICHFRKCTGEIKNINDGSVPFRPQRYLLISFLFFFILSTQHSFYKISLHTHKCKIKIPHIQESMPSQ